MPRELNTGDLYATLILTAESPPEKPSDKTPAQERHTIHCNRSDHHLFRNKTWLPLSTRTSLSVIYLVASLPQPAKKPTWGNTLATLAILETPTLFEAVFSASLVRAARRCVDHRRGSRVRAVSSYFSVFDYIDFAYHYYDRVRISSPRPSNRKDKKLLSFRCLLFLKFHTVIFDGSGRLNYGW